MRASQGRGQTLPEPQKDFFEKRFGEDFSNVRVHTDSNAAQLASAIDAKAFTSGADIFFGKNMFKPGTQQGDRLTAHELTHVVQQTKTTTKRQTNSRIDGGAKLIQRQTLEDRSLEAAMRGLKFKLTADHASYRAGTIVKIKDWKRKKLEARVSVPTAGYFSKDYWYGILVPKTILYPVEAPRTPGIAQYALGAKVGKTGGFVTIEKQRQNIERYGASKTRIRVLDDILFKSSHYNRFDANIKRWVDYYNNHSDPRFHFARRDPLNPNYFKSMIFHESQMGTGGPHMASDRGHFLNQRFNVTQSVDSSGPIFLLMMREMGPETIRNRAGEIERAYNRTQGRFWELRKKTSKSPAETKEYERLHFFEGRSKKGTGNWFDWFWSSRDGFDARRRPIYKSPVYDKWSRLVNDFSAENSSFLGDRLVQTYDFYIRAGIRWLFEKRMNPKVRSWEAAIRAYNGGGSKAAKYQRSVLRRAHRAMEAQRRGRRHQPMR